MPFLRNAWYVAAWGEEVPPDGMFHRRLLGEDVLIARDEDGSPHALRNVCPHRFAPLHLGERNGDVITCAYHGLAFDLSGACVHNPHGDGRVPPNATVRHYPIIERDLLIWIWMGDLEKADEALPPKLAGLDPDRFAINKGYMHTPVSYELMTDNIMDLGHIQFLHKGLLGSEAVLNAEIEVRRAGDVVYSNRVTRGEILPPALEALYETGGLPVDRWLDVTWFPPGNMQLVVGVAPAGAAERVGREAPGVHLMTPETEITTHYFWSSARSFRRDDADLHAALDAGFRFAFEQQDKPMITAQQASLNGSEFWEMKPVILAGDAGAVLARRVLQKLIQDEEKALAS